MKLTVDIDLEAIVVSDWGDTVGGLVRDEIISTLRSAVRKELKANEKKIQALVKEVGFLSLEEAERLIKELKGKKGK